MEWEIQSVHKDYDIHVGKSWKYWVRDYCGARFAVMTYTDRDVVVGWFETLDAAKALCVLLVG